MPGSGVFLCSLSRRPWIVYKILFQKSVGVWGRVRKEVERRILRRGNHCKENLIYFMVTNPNS
jgi:hypothetical protein